jgi:hypothetical protein
MLELDRLHRAGSDVHPQKRLAALNTLQHLKTLSSSIDDLYLLKPFINVVRLIILAVRFVKQKMGQVLPSPSLLEKRLVSASPLWGEAEGSGELPERGDRSRLALPRSYFALALADVSAKEISSRRRWLPHP